MFNSKNINYILANGRKFLFKIPTESLPVKEFGTFKIVYLWTELIWVVKELAVENFFLQLEHVKWAAFIIN